MSEREQIEQLQKNMFEVIRKRAAFFEQIKGIADIGVGLRRRNGAYTNEICISIDVASKQPAAALPEGQLLPESLDNFPIDVTQREERTNAVLRLRAGDVPDAPTWRPLLGGAQITNGKVGIDGTVDWGTLGAIVYMKPKKKDEFYGILSNQHVLYADGGIDGTVIGQPNEKNPIATNWAGVNLPSSKIDIGVAKLDNSITFKNAVVGIDGELKGIRNAVIDEEVTKSGAKSGVTFGKVTFVSDDEVRVVAGDPINPAKKFSDFGDSGSVLIACNDMNVIGLIYNIYDVLGDYKTFATSAAQLKKFSGDIIIPPPIGDGVVGVQMDQFLSDPKRLGKYKATMEQSAAGRELLCAIVDCFEEGTSLVNKQRECMVAWQRCKGPDFISLEKRLNENERFVFRKNIDGVSLDEFFQTMHRVFEKHGSQRFAELVRQHGATIERLAKSCDSVEEMLEMLNTSPPK